MQLVDDKTKEYYNGAIEQITTHSSTLISSSPYLNNPVLRALIAQEMLRRNGPDVPNTAYIPEVAGILHQMEDIPNIVRLFEIQKQKSPEFKAWLDGKILSNFKVEEVKDSAPGTLGAVIHDFLANSGYSIDHFFQELEVTDDFTFYLKERAYTHDIEHMITGFETNYAGEIALLAANERALYLYFEPELAAFMNRVGAYLKSKTVLKMGLYYPEAYGVMLEATEVGYLQGKNWKHPMMLVPWRNYVDWKVEDIREEFGITNPPAPGIWDWTTATSEDPQPEDLKKAAE